MNPVALPRIRRRAAARPGTRQAAILPSQSVDGSVGAPPEVVMFVLNPVSHDRRVLKEASSLTRAGYRVAIIGINLARQPRPARETTPDGVVIVRVPLSMVPERWRPSTRYFTRMRDQLRRRRVLLAAVRRRVAQRARRRRGHLRLAYQRRRHRIARGGRRIWRQRTAATRLAAQRRRHAIANIGRAWRHHPRREWSRLRVRSRRMRGAPSRVRQRLTGTPYRVRRRLSTGRRYAARRLIRGRVQLARWKRLASAFSRRQVRRAGRLASQPQARRWAMYRARRSGGRRLAQIRTSSGRGAAILARSARVVTLAPIHVLFTGWAAVYLSINSLSGGEIDWLLNTRQRWRSFAKSAAEVAPAAAIYHGHDFSALGAALAARRRHGGVVVYDSHEVYLEAGTIGRRSRALKNLLKRVEKRQYSEADRLICVNRMVAEELHRRYGPKPTILIHNCPPRWIAPPRRPDLIRAAAGIPADLPVALYQGGFTPVRGLRQMADAVCQPGLERVHLVYMGFGPMEDELRAMAADPRFGGRLHVLAAVAPEILDAWVASADVSLMPNQPDTLNEIVSTPNKLFESIAAGVPVVTSDFPERRRIVLEDPLGPLGAVCDPTDPRAIADAVRAVLGGSRAEREAIRSRCLAAAHARWNWETEEERLVQLYRELMPARASSNETVQAGI